MSVRFAHLVNDSTRFIWNVPLGKPDPNQVCSLDRETRGRVVQTAQKGDDCWYYVMNELRIRIGKHSDSPKREREIEQLCSWLRKELQKYLNFERVMRVLEGNTPSAPLLQQVTLSMAQKCASKPDQYKQRLAAVEGGGDGEYLWAYLVEFAEKGGHENFHDFLCQKRMGKEIEIIKGFLQKVIDRKEFFPEGLEGEEAYAFARRSIDDPKIQTWDLARQRMMYYTTMHKVCAALYGLKQSQWSPESGFDGLMTELKEKGPLYSAGAFGILYYQDPPTLREKVEGRAIYAWSKGSARKPKTNIGHAVLCIGAEKIQERGFVFFTDPQDPSDPKDFSSRKIYKISFENWKTHSLNLEGFRPGVCRPIPNDLYFYYGPPLKTPPLPE